MHRQDDLRAAANEVVPGVIWRELNALDELDYAVEVGVVSLPAIAIDGQLVFSSLPPVYSEWRDGALIAPDATLVYVSTKSAICAADDCKHF